jgi:hypothetical protein
MPEEKNKDQANQNTELSEDRLEEASGGYGRSGNDIILGQSGRDYSKVSNDRPQKAGDALPTEEISLNFEK